MGLQAAEPATERVIELLERAVNSELQRLRQVGHCNRGIIREPCFQHAPLVRVPALVSIFIAEVHRNAGDAITEVCQCVCDHAGQPGRHLFSNVHVIIVIHLYLHIALRLLAARGQLQQ